MAGLTVATLLEQAGRRVVVVEADRIGNGRGAGEDSTFLFTRPREPPELQPKKRLTFADSPTARHR
jgi:glycine/D-amino acid oxidase-like deaminating enzyme